MSSSMLEVYHNPKAISDMLKEHIEDYVYEDNNLKCIDARRPDPEE
jgi:hypothetical protein